MPLDHDGPPPDRDTFARALVEAIGQSEGGRGEVTYEPAGFKLTGGMGAVHEASLANVFAEYCRSGPAARAKIFRNVVRSWFSPLKGVPTDFEDAAHDLLPSVRARSYVEVNLLHFQAQGAKDFDWPYASLGEHLSLSLVYDLPESFLAVQRAHLEGWKVEFPQALQRAGENLLNISGHLFRQPSPGVWRSPWRDNHDTARMILLPLVLAHEVKGTHVAMVPNRDTFLLAGDGDPEALAAFAALGEKEYDHPRCVSGHAFRLSEGTWQPWLPEEGHPAYLTLHRLHLRSLSDDYSSQKPPLKAWFASRGEEVLVGECIFRTKPTGEAATFAPWLEGHDTALPQADLVGLCRPDLGADGILGIVEWQRLREVVGDLLVPMDLYPPRFRAREFPPDAMIAELFADQQDPGQGQAKE